MKCFCFHQLMIKIRDELHVSLITVDGQYEDFQCCGRHYASSGTARYVTHLFLDCSWHILQRCLNPLRIKMTMRTDLSEVPDQQTITCCHRKTVLEVGNGVEAFRIFRTLPYIDQTVPAESPKALSSDQAYCHRLFWSSEIAHQDTPFLRINYLRAACLTRRVPVSLWASAT